MYELAGHDGSMVVAPEEQGAYKYRGFFDRELIDIAYSQGWLLTRIDRHLRCKTYQQNSFRDEVFFKYIEEQLTIICGRFPRMHAVVCDRSFVYDPKGFVHDYQTWIRKEYENVDYLYVFSRM